MTIFETKGLTKTFGGLTAVDGVDLEVQEREIVGLIGPNGAGKTTFFNLVSGALRATSGKIIWQGHDITCMPMHKISKMGLVRSFQTNSLFRDMTVVQNLLVASHMHFSNPKNVLERIEELLNFLELRNFKNELAANLAHGHQRALGIGIALAADPKGLLLDEPFSGMNPEEILLFSHKIGLLREKGITIIIIEHRVEAIMDLCQRIFVLNFGKKIAEGPPQEVVKNQDVIKAYLGMEYDTPT
jgi:branched-chain amino acid transport system ATP-binding protein